MKFHVESLQLWMKSGHRRTLSFLPNKVNIITGESHTGKTAILDIFDYCFFASKHRISESIINENVAWYGLKIHINGKLYSFARRSPVGSTPSKEYYFSSTGVVPKSEPRANISEAALKKLFSADFGIDNDVKVSFGGRSIKADSKISIRYFLLFNTISQNIITHSDQFFDKQNEARYQEALPRIFDMAVGIDTVENILRREKRTELERSLAYQKKVLAKSEDKRVQFNAQLIETVARAKGFGLIAEDPDVSNSIAALRQTVINGDGDAGLHVSEKHEELSTEVYRVARKIRGLTRFASEYQNHKATLKETEDSLRPVEYLLSKFQETVKTSVFDEMLRGLSQGLEQIRAGIAGKTPLDSNISEIVKGLRVRHADLTNQIKAFPSDMEGFNSNKEKYVFIGETRAKFEIFDDSENSEMSSNRDIISRLENELDNLVVESVEERKALFIRALDDAIQDYISLTRAALGNYGSYRSAFSYSEMKLNLRKPKTASTENVGSSSNHMFLHLFMFLGLHELIMRSGGDHVAPFLIIDQFSRPYWGEDGQEVPAPEEDVAESDVAKVKLALELLNNFIKIAKDMGNGFQMIVFEHINPRYWTGLENVHLVEEFRDGNALIPLSELNSAV